MQFMLLIMEPRGQRAARNDAEGRAVYDRMLRHADALKERGVLRAAQSLRNDREGMRVKLRDGKRTLVDGPFTEAKEMVGGYFLVECASRDEAVEIASRIPAAEWATIEVREFGPCFM
ncbi:MAG: YciI family protein [Betaproteobacteria bacterium]